MGIPGILGQIGKGERVALAKLAIEHLEKNNRPLRIAIDAAIWDFQNAAGQGGRNPALRTLFFRLLKLLALPIHPVFVYDGPNRPLTKRGRTVSRYGTRKENEMAKQLLSHFRFPHHTAPGEAEAECAFLQSNGIVDAVMSQDVDAVMFGSTITLRDWSKEGTRGNKTPTHVNVLDASSISKMSGIDAAGMVLVALLSGGDYDEGVSGFGSSLACEIARAGFGKDLLDVVRDGEPNGLKEWKERLEFELQTNESGYFKRRHLKLSLPEQFPNPTIFDYYTTPAVSSRDSLAIFEEDWLREWKTEIDVVALRQYTDETFDWSWRSGARRFVRCFAQPLFQDRLQRGVVQQSLFTGDSIIDERKHFTNDGIVEMRFTAVPADVVGIDIEAENEKPEFVSSQHEIQLPEEDLLEGDELEAETPAEPANNSLKRRIPWSPYLAEKWWIPSTLLQIGLGALVEEWEQKQREILADPRKFATRKCQKTNKHTIPLDKGMKSGAMLTFLGQQSMAAGLSSTGLDDLQSKRQHQKQVPSLASTKTQIHTSTKSHASSIEEFFKPRKSTVSVAGNTVTNFPSQTATVDDEERRNDGQKEFKIIKANKSDQTTRARRGNLKKASSGNDSSVTEGPPYKQHPGHHGSHQTESPEVQDDSKMTNQQLNHTLDKSVNRGRNQRLAPQSGQRRLPHTRQVPDEPLPIESFFGPTKSLDRSEASDASSNIKPRKAAGVHAVPRESLPGTWKELDETPPSNRHGQRVNYIDLTDD